MTEANLRIIEECDNEINNIKQWISKNTFDSNVRYLISYSVVKASGTLERVYKSMIYDYLADGVRSETQEYLTKMIVDSSSNPNTGNISHLLEQISNQKKDNFASALKGTQTKVDVNALVQLRNDIAHGKAIASSIEIIERYYIEGKNMLKILEEILVEE